MEIILMLVSEIQAARGIEDVDISGLIKQGYTQLEISVALSWLLQQMKGELINFTKLEQPNTQSSFRIMLESERSLFTSDALAELMQYLSFGLLKHEQLELIFDKSMALPGTKITVSALRVLMSEFLYVNEQTKPGNRTHLTMSDSVH